MCTESRDWVVRKEKWDKNSKSTKIFIILIKVSVNKKICWQKVITWSFITFLPHIIHPYSISIQMWWHLKTKERKYRQILCIFGLLFYEHLQNLIKSSLQTKFFLFVVVFLEALQKERPDDIFLESNDIMQRRGKRENRLFSFHNL